MGGFERQRCKIGESPEGCNKKFFMSSFPFPVAWACVGGTPDSLEVQRLEDRQLDIG